MKTDTKDSSLKKGWKELAAAVGFCSAAALICGTASFYMVKAQYYEEHFFTNTEVNGVLVEGLTQKKQLSGYWKDCQSMS